MISLVKFCSFAYLIFFQTINFTSARLATNQKSSLESVPVILDAIRDRSTSSSSLVPIGTLWGGATGDNFGSSLSLSYNGDELAVGSPGNDEGELSYVGLAQVFHQKNVSLWVEAWYSIGGYKNDEFGYSISLSGDANILAVGTFNGYVKLVDMETGKVISIDGDESDRGFGEKVAVSHDGNRTAVVGYDYARVFGTEEDEGIYQIGHDFLTDSWSIVDLSADGDILAIGERSYNRNKGRVRIFEWNSSEWKQLGQDMKGEDVNDLFGDSLDLAADGHRVIIGSLGGNYAKVYDYDGSTWEVVGGKLSGESIDNGYFGYSVSISDNGSRIIIGSPFFTSKGRAIVYQYGIDAWYQLGNDILGKNDSDYAGFTVAISGNGNILSIGAPWADSDRGYVMIYEVN